MRFTRKNLRLATLGLALLGSVGCGGFRGSYSVSPLTFLLPGLVKTERPTDGPGSTEASADGTLKVAAVR